MPHPSLYTDYRTAKKAAGALASAVGATLLQDAKGKPRIILGDRVSTFPTWLSAWSYLYRIRCDQVGVRK